MFVYIMMLAASVILGVILCDSKYGKIGKAVYCAAGAIAFIVISSVRYLVGTDFNTYGQGYVNALYMDFSQFLTVRTEKGFAFSAYYLPGLLTDDYYAVFVVTSVIIYSSIFWLIYKNSSIPWVSVSAFLCMGVYFVSLDFLRQFIAGIIVTYALRFITEKRPLYFFTLVFAASAFHWSALIMLALYFLIRIKPGYIYLGLTAVGAVIAFIFSHDIMKFAVSHIYVYRSYDPDISTEATIGLSPRDTVVLSVMFVIIFLFRKRLMEKNPANGLYINLFMYSLVFEVLSMHHAILSRFMILTYIAPMLYLIPDTAIVVREFIADHFKDGSKRFFANISAASAASVFGAAMYLMLMSSNDNDVMPYRSIAERNVRAERPYLEEEILPSDEAEITFDEDIDDDDDDEEEYFADELDFSDEDGSDDGKPVGEDSDDIDYEEEDEDEDEEEIE